MKTLRRGFTLVEVLMVIAILGLLSGIVFAAMGPVREKARQTVCISNLRQIRQALAMYQADYDGVEPAEDAPMQYWQLGLPSPEGRFSFVPTYVKNKPVMFCPDYIKQADDLTISSYHWCFGPDEDNVGSNKFSRVVARMGMDTPLFICESHNPPFDLASEPRWIRKKVIILRLSGQAKVKEVRVRDTYPY